MGYGERQSSPLEDKVDFSQVTIILCVFLLSYVYGEGKVIGFRAFLLRATAN